jgi:uroporphyrinogen III methyltransferase/synthase
MTLRGAECLAKADVVLYDRLVSSAVLEMSPPHAELVYVGKRPDHHPVPQEMINEALIAHAQTGQTVVRLHGGDSFVFGRGGEEAQMLAAAGIPFEIVPGITSAVAAPAYAGIPVTHRDYSTSFAVITGHRRAEAGEALPAFPDAGTLVFLMPVRNLARIVARLLENGRSPQTPAALIHRGTQPQQKTVTGTLENIVERTQEIKPPAAFVVGPVVQLHEQIAWFENRLGMVVSG